MEYLEFLQERSDECETYNEMIEFLVTEALHHHLLLQRMLYVLNEEYDIQFEDLITDEEMDTITSCEIKIGSRPGGCCCEVDDFDDDEIEYGTIEDLETDDDDDDEKYDIDEVTRLVGELYQELTNQKGKH